MTISSNLYVSIAEGVGIPWVPLQALERLARGSFRVVQAAWRLLWATRRLTGAGQDAWRLQLASLRLAGPFKANARL